jgi:hypothetical protein
MSTSMGRTPRIVDTPITTGTRRLDWGEGVACNGCVEGGGSDRIGPREPETRRWHLDESTAAWKTHLVVRHLPNEPPANAAHRGAHPKEGDEERGLFHWQALLL